MIIKLNIVKEIMMKKRYNIQKIQPLKGGVSGNTFLLFIKNEKYVLKLFPYSKIKSVQHDIDFCRMINKKKEIVIQPIHAKALNLGTYTGYIYRYVPYKLFHNVTIPKKMFTFGKIVGEWNALYKRRIPETQSNKIFKRTIQWSNNTIRALKKEKKFQKTRNSMIHGTAKLEKEYDGSTYRTQLLHRDIHYYNVFYNEKTEKYVIADISETERDILPSEIAVILSEKIKDSPTTNMKDIREIMKGYSTKIKLTRKERNVIPLLMITRKLGECMWLFEQKKKRRISKKIFQRSLKETTRQLETILEQFDHLKKVFQEV